MANDRLAARQQIEKLVQFFDSNIYQLKSPSFNETQARQQLIDPFFESFGWDMHNRLMLPLFRQEVVPESRVKTNVGKEVREQEPLFPKKETLGKEYKEYTSILDYIAEDEYKASSKEAVKKPDYRFRIGGQTKFFVEAKKPSVDLAKSQSAIFQVKRYGFSGRVPLAILTDFEEFRTFDCTQRPLFEKPKLGVIHDFDLTYKQYLDHFDHLYDTFSREAVAAGSLEALTKKMMLKRTGDFALDREFLEDLSKWREELARDIAKHPKNRRLLNDYTLNEAVQRILDRIIFIRVCEDREIEVENTLLAILRMWKERRGLSLYSLLNDLFKQRRALYNGLLFSPHQCEELEVGDEVLIKILENLNYPFSPYHFNEIGVEILGSIYEKFLGKTLHLLTNYTVRANPKPEVRKAGGVYYTPQYIVKYIVDNTLGKLLYEDDGKQSPLLIGEGQGEVLKVKPTLGPPVVPLTGGHLDHQKLKLSPKQVAKLKIIDIACGSGSFLLGAFQKLIDYHIEWYTAHPEDIKTENSVPDAYKDTGGNYHLSPRKKRDILVNNIYGVDIDRQAVEVTQMSLYLKVLEGENAETLNPQMTLALKEVYLPSLANNIKCGNSLIGTDFTSQGEMFDEDARRKVNPFDWELEFPEILGSKMNPPPTAPPFNEGGNKGGFGFDVVIGNPPYIPIETMNEAERKYYQSCFPELQRKYDSSVIFILAGMTLLKKTGFLGFISSITWQTGENYSLLRKTLFERGAVDCLINLPFDVFGDVYVDTGIYVLSGSPRQYYNIYRFPKKAQVENLEHIDYVKIKSSLVISPEFKIILEPKLANILKRFSFNTNMVELGSISMSTQGLAGNMFVLGKKQSSKDRMKYLEKGQVYRYDIQLSKVAYTDMKDKESLVRFYTKTPKILIRRVINREDRLMATYYEEEMVFKKDINPFVINKDNLSTKYILSLVNSKFMSYLYMNISSIATKDDFRQTTLGELRRLPIRTIDFTKPAEKKMHDNLVSLVEKMLELNKQLQKAHFNSEKEPIERQIAATDKKIDELVYQLYGLTEEEIKIVEGKT
jgi:type I restriction-modification system DNA methylase subunit